MIYLASPYSHSDPAVRAARFEAVCRAAAGLIRDGARIFSPIAHSHPIAQYGLADTPFAYWQEMDEHMICACDELWVLTLDGWEQSVGVKHEIAFAEARGMPIRYLEP